MMQKFDLLSASFAVASALIALSAPASAQNARSWVASSGNDNNSCVRTTPCQTFTGALAKTNINGEIDCLDRVDYVNGITITKSITINCSDGFGEGFFQINIPSGAAGDARRTVRLRGIDLQGFSVANGQGIWILAAAVVILDNVRVSSYGQFGILDQRSGGGNMLIIRNSIIENNGGPGIIAAAGATSGVVLDNVQSSKNVYGLAVGTGNNVVVNRSVFSGNSAAGIEADAGAQVTVDNSVISHNNIGILANGAIRLSNNDILFNNAGISGPTTSFGNNRVSGNASGGTFPTPAGGSSPDLGQE